MHVVRLAARQARDPEEEGGGEHLHRRGEERAARERRAARIERACGPSRRRRDEDERDADVVSAAGADEQRVTDEAHDQPGDRDWREPAAEEDPIEERDVERDDRDDQRGEAGVEPRLSPGDAAVAYEQERGAGDRGRCPLPARRPRASARCEGVERRARDQEADGRHQQRRQRPIRDADREIGRSPDEVDRPERESHRRR